MTEEKETRDYTTGLTLIPCKPEVVTVIWKRGCRSCKKEFTTDNKNQFVCDGCLKTYEFELGGLNIAQKEEIGVPLKELRIVKK